MKLKLELMNLKLITPRGAKLVWDDVMDTRRMFKYYYYDMLSALGQLHFTILDDIKL